MSEDVQKKEANEQVAIRKQKLKNLTDAGINAYGEKFTGTIHSETLKASYQEDTEGQACRVAGRVMTMRVMGKALFATIQDEEGRIQIYAKRDQMDQDEFNRMKKADIGDIIGVDGELFKTQKDEITVRTATYKVLAKAVRPLPEKFHGLKDVETRYRQRYLDLISNDESRKVFRQRAQIISAMREYLESDKYMEVETPMMHPIPGGASARPFVTHYNALDQEMFMRIAPELYLKMLLVGGFERVFEINRNFRNEGVSKQHNPEFTAIEAYQAYGDCSTMMDLMQGILRHCAQKVIGTLQIKHSEDKIIDLEKDFRQVTHHDLMCEHTVANWFEISDEERSKIGREMGCSIMPGWTEEEITEEIYSKKIEPTLIQPTFVTRLPVHMVPLAKRCEDNPELVDVFELVCDGKELAPGYSELNDPVEQRKRLMAQFERAKGTEEEDSGRIDESFLVALEHGMPPAGGMGMGVDRLVMMLTGAPTIRDVILFPQLKNQH